ncbi:MAG: phosphoribosylamine--glycine ligase [Chitinophagales bacterium]|nr:phosphoribosylamine--glycine ligase [Chitinophagales bacterium]
MNILLLGSGGREHAFAHSIAKSNKCSQLFIAPGNPGTLQLGINVPIATTDFAAIKSFALENEIKMIIVGPEAPLVEGIYDFVVNDAELRHIPVIGPSKIGAQLEGSKAFSKAFMKRHQVPTAAYAEFTMATLNEGLAYLSQQTPPIVLKADGLAAGKGVLICSSIDEAKDEFKQMLDGKFGDASAKVVIEEFMDGIEFSVFVLTDGKDYKILPTAKDYKRIGEADTGLNTGGMGAVSPPPFVTDDMMKTVEDTIIKPTIQGFQKDGIVYIGFVYVGLMYLKTGEIKVVEYNCRMGDPETEAVFPRWKNDIIEVFQSTVDGRLSNVDIDIDERAATTIILASGGYPEDFEKGKAITGIDEIKDSIVFHCGTKLIEDDKGQSILVSNGGRVLAVTSLHVDWKSALAISNKNASIIQYEAKYYRKDIGFDL